MSDAEIFLWPLAVFFACGWAGAAWQASHPVTELAANERLLERNWEVKRWRRMPLWRRYRAQHDDADRFARSAARRAKLFALLGLIAAAAALSAS